MQIYEDERIKYINSMWDQTDCKWRFMVRSQLKVVTHSLLFAEDLVDYILAPILRFLSDDYLFNFDDLIEQVFLPKARELAQALANLYKE